jgi:hypothetical protein
MLQLGGMRVMFIRLIAYVATVEPLDSLHYQ